MPKTIGVFPAAGGLGGATVSHLLNTSHVDPASVFLVARHPEKLEKEKRKGASVRQADYDNVDSLRGVFNGVDVLNIISYPTFEHEHRFEVCLHFHFPFPALLPLPLPPSHDRDPLTRNLRSPKQQ